jgi:hypothetical protein
VAQIPGPNSDWLPLAATQYIVGAASTALTIPNPATQTPPVKNSGNMVIAAFLIPQGAAYWMRGDGTAAVATVTGGLKINIGDYRIVYGFPALIKIRVIQDGAGGALQVEYFLYRNQPVGP